MKKILYILPLLILFLTPNVFAQDFTVSSTNITSPNSSGSGKYTGTEIYNTGTANVYNMNTRYNGRLSRIVFNLSPGGYAETTSNFDLGKTYTLTLNMATDDWRNNFGSVSVKCNGSSGTELSNGRVNYISYRKINFSFTTGSNTCSFVYVDLKSSNIINTAFTGVSNWNLSSMVITDPTFDSGSSGGSSGGGSSGSSNQDIIDSNTTNANNIINNNTNNTNNIIENNNQNTKEITDTIKDATSNCFTNIFNAASYSSTDFTNVSISNNNITANASTEWRTFTYTFPVEPNNEYTLHYNSPQNNAIMYRSVDGGTWNQVNKGIYHHFTPTSSTVTIRLQNTSGSGTFNFNELMLVKGNVSSYYKLGETCKSKIDETTNAINETNDYLMDDSDPNISDNEFTDLFNTVGFNDPLGYLLQLPVQFINQLVSQSNSCQTISLGTLWGVSLSLPCIDIGSIIGQQVWDIIDVLFSVGLLVVILKNLYQTFANLMTMGGEKEAREKFSMPTPMEFLSLILGGDR